MRRLPPTGALEAFLVTARVGTLKAASSNLNLSVSALSRRIQSLEAYIGQSLFERLHHEFRLTAVGEKLLTGLEPTFEQLGLLLEELRDEPKHHLRLGVSASFAIAWLIPRLYKFKELHPDVELHLDSSGSPVSKLGITLDAIILFANRERQEIELDEFRRQRAFAVAAPELVDTRLGIRKALQEYPILLHSGLPEILPCWLNEVGCADVQPQRVEYYDDGPLLVSAAENRLGIALVLEDMVNFYQRRAEIIRPFGECAQTPYSYSLGTKLATGSGRALNWFRVWLLEEAKNDERLLLKALEMA